MCMHFTVSLSIFVMSDVSNGLLSFSETQALGERELTPCGSGDSELRVLVVSEMTE